MTQQGGADIGELLRRLGQEALLSEAESAGLAPRAGRVRCPFEGCQDKGPGRERDAVVYAGGHPRVHCFACGTTGDLVDVLQQTRGWTRAQALSHLGALPPPTRPAPQLRVVGGDAAADEGKLPPAEVKRLWDGCAADDARGRAYLESRSLGDAVGLGLVRFATEAHPDGRSGGVKALARRGYLVAALLFDVVGNPRGVQVRLAREARAKEPKVLTVKDTVSGRAFFGHPHLIEASPVVAVAEGLADTLAVAAWARRHPEVAVVGAAGKGALPRLADELEAAGVGCAGKYFCLFPQNDRPANESRRQFVRLAQRLGQLGATVVLAATAAEWKDVADWRRAQPDGEWPPAELRRVVLPQPGDETPAEDRRVLPDGCAVPIPAQVRTDSYAKNFTTLCALLDDASTRLAVAGEGELSWCEMTQRVRLGAREVTAVDLAAIRLGLEQQARSTDGKPLQFGVEDVDSALTLLARRRPKHPVRDWLRGLRWDGRHRLEVELPQALGHEAGSFAATLLKRWFISAVARPIRPGCKVDTVLVLVGTGRIGKSSFFAALGEEYFTDSPVRVDDKDGKQVMREAWIVEWGELEAMKRAKDYEAIKAFLSAREDWFRLPYGRDVQKVKRHSVIVGTFSTSRQFLQDAEDARRFWPLVITRVDVEWVRQHREQLFAEAVALYDAGVQWWLTPEEDAQLLETLREHEVEDAWRDPVADWLSDNPQATRVTTGQLLHLALGKKMEDWTQHDEKRVAGILRQLGWEGPRRERTDAGVRRVFARPGCLL